MKRNQQQNINPVNKRNKRIETKIRYLEVLDDLLFVTRRIRNRLDNARVEYYMYSCVFSEAIQCYSWVENTPLKSGYHISKEPDPIIAAQRGLWTCSHPENRNPSRTLHYLCGKYREYYNEMIRHPY